MMLTNQQGVTLPIALVFLLALTLLGTAAITTSAFQERMSHNMREHTLAFQAAESALIEAENWLMSLTAEPNPEVSCSSQPCVINLDPTRYFEEQDDTWWSSDSNTAAFSDGSISGVSNQPRYVIEYFRFVADTPTVGQGVPEGVHYYRITAKGYGGDGNAFVILQTTLARRY